MTNIELTISNSLNWIFNFIYTFFIVSFFLILSSLCVNLFLDITQINTLAYFITGPISPKFYDVTSYLIFVLFNTILFTVILKKIIYKQSFELSNVLNFLFYGLIFIGVSVAIFCEIYYLRHLFFISPASEIGQNMTDEFYGFHRMLLVFTVVITPVISLILIYIINWIKTKHSK